MDSGGRGVRVFSPPQVWGRPARSLTPGSGNGRASTARSRHSGAHSGDKALSWTSAADRKWDLYGTNIAAPDVMLYAMGSNDWAEGVDVATLQERVEANVIEIRERFTSTVYGTTITPRRRRASNDSTRLEFNESLSSSGLFHEVFDLAAAVALPDGTLDPAVDADGVHVNSLGHARLGSRRSRLHHQARYTTSPSLIVSSTLMSRMP